MYLYMSVYIVQYIMDWVPYNVLTHADVLHIRPIAVYARDAKVGLSTSSL